MKDWKDLLETAIGILEKAGIKVEALSLKIDKNPSRCEFVSEINKGICETNMHITGQN